MSFGLALSVERFDMREPFVTAAESLDHIDVLTVELEDDAYRGRGEALGVDYLGETAVSIAAQLEALRAHIEAGLDTADALQLLPPGGARNALDCALWDLRAKRAGRRVWELLALRAAPVTCAVTLAMADGERMVKQALNLAAFPLLKLKLDARDLGDKLSALRAARPDATLIVDANGCWSDDVLDAVADTLVKQRIAMIEQPLPRGGDEYLDGLNYPVTLCADESCQNLSELATVAQRYDMINIKLDKCGGLSEALSMLSWCETRGKQAMIGNMLGSSLAMAPGFVIAQHCTYADLDGPLLQSRDRQYPIRYDGALMHAPDARLWG